METEFDYQHTTAQQLAKHLQELEHELAEGQARLQQRRAELRAAIGQLRNISGGVSDLAWELEEIEQRLRELQIQPQHPADPLAEHERDSISRRQADIEEQSIAQMLQADQLAASIAANEQALASASSEWAEREKQLQAERARILAALALKAQELG